VIAKLREPGPYRHPELADEMEREWEAERTGAPQTEEEPA
jgi:hypothetical protein